MTPPWHWQTWNDHPYLTTSLLADWPHGFFTSQSWPHPPETLIEGLDDGALVYRVKQVHGNQVLSPKEVPAAPLAETDPRPEADAVITQTTQQAVWVCSADCTPALIADADTGQVAAVHAGWRGTALKILPATIAQMQAQGSQLENLRIALGPAISGEVYQVSNHVATEVGRTVAPPDTDGPAVIQELQSWEPPPLLLDDAPGRSRLDVRQINWRQLTQLGLDAEQIAIAPHCTYQEPDRFFSYRRTREKKVQWSGIVSR
jgi:hypothetical protein